ncbi:hypothetical protein F5Y04DRAFT_251538 [Hypomontagnella monticulosa]|nr:hypothetical protein F5Y04DRAFT_251538 [Hypomontagnella monticulosa]
MMMGPFPALIPDEDSKVKGMCWKCEEPRHVANLRRYETKSYRMEYCEIIKEDGKIIENGRVFVSTLDMDYLDEGAFDLDEFKRECDYMFDFDEEEEEDC